MDITKLPLRIRAASLIINDKGELLIIRVKDREIWTSLGGGIEEGETGEECVAREIMEEVGLTATDVKYYIETPIEMAAGSTDKAVKIIFYLIKTRGEIALRPEEVIAEYRWINKADFDEIKKGNSIKIGSGLELYAIPKLITDGLMM